MPEDSPVKFLNTSSAWTEDLIRDITRFWQNEEDINLTRQTSLFIEQNCSNLIHEQTGEDYVDYARNLATVLVAIRADPITISAAMLYQLPFRPHSTIEFQDLAKIFRNDVLELMRDTFNLGILEYETLWPTARKHNDLFKERNEILKKMFLFAVSDVSVNDRSSEKHKACFQKLEKQVQNLVGMFLAEVQDVRALTIKLVDLQHFLQICNNRLTTQAQLDEYRLLAKITLSIYASVADRLGIWPLKSELEDLSFRIIQLDSFEEIFKQINAQNEVRKISIVNLINKFNKLLEMYGIKAEISGRPKHLYSIYRKIYEKELSFEKINDLSGIRIIVNTPEDCYNVQDVIQNTWEPVTTFYGGKTFRDWIAKPKNNLYQSLHSTLKIDNELVEVQIRTHKMHKIAEYGIASHEHYKGKSYRRNKTLAAKESRNEIWKNLRKNLDGIQEPGTTVSRIRSKDLIYVITPKGHVIDLVLGSTPIDFAYRIHTTLGHECMGAKVDGRLVSLDHQLKNGDCVEIMASRTRKGPNPEWLRLTKGENGKSYYPFARTRQARNKIRTWFNRQKHYDQSVIRS